MRLLARVLPFVLLLVLACDSGGRRGSPGGGRGGGGGGGGGNVPTTDTGVPTGQDGGAAMCTCDLVPNVCDSGCACDVACQGACACDVTPNVCDQGCACDAICMAGCACDTTPGVCDEGCACDPVCGGGCACDIVPGVCDQGCACDPQCGNTGTDAGMVDCSTNPNGCAPRELIDPRNCRCLNICEAGFMYDTNTRTCVPIGGNPDSGVPNVPDTGVPPVMGDPFDANRRASEFANALCQFRGRCEPAALQFGGDTVASCIATEGARFGSIYGAVGQAASAGRIAYSQSQFDACIRGLNTGQCVLGVPQACDGIFTGNVPLGGRCALIDECAAGSWCNAPIAGCGSCVARVADGQDCGAGLCNDGSQCVNAGAMSVCVRLNPEFAACGSIATGLCQGHLQCVGGASGTCRRPSNIGATCDPTLMTTDACDIFAGGTCDENTNRCVAVNFVGGNQTCGGANQCNDTTGGCDPNTMTCLALPTAGQACLSGECAPGAFCDGVTCAAVAGLNQACRPNGCNTDRGEFCANGTCQRLPWQLCN